MKRICVVATFFTCTMAMAIQAYAGLDLGDHWYKGELVLQNGEILKGELQLNLDLNTVLLKQQDVIKAYSPYWVDHFRFSETEKLRTFYTLPYQQEGGVEKLMFFELIFDDNFALFNREVTVHKEYASLIGLPFSGNPTDAHHVRACEYYLFLPEGELVRLETNPAEVSNQLASSNEEKKEINAFIYGQNLDLRRRSDMIKVLNYFINEKEESNT